MTAVDMTGIAVLLATVILAALKLSHIMAISWAIVFSPVWGTTVAGIVIGFFLWVLFTQ